MKLLLKIPTGVMIVCLSLLCCSCLKVKEKLSIQKNGKGEMSLEWDLSLLDLYPGSEKYRQTIQRGLEELGAGLSQLEDVEVKEARIVTQKNQARLHFSFKSVAALNSALTYVYIGEGSGREIFFEQGESELIRRQLPEFGQNLLKRWEELWSTPLKGEEKDNFLFESEIVCKSIVQLVYAPVKVDISADQHQASWRFRGTDLFDDKPKSVKILLD